MNKFLIFSFLLSAFTFGFSISHRVHAASEQFHTKVQVTYHFDPQGNSQVTQEYSLTNLTSETGASSYEFDILDQTPQNLTAHDSHGSLNLKIVTHQSGLTRVLIPFKQLTAGKGKTYDFYLTYSGPSVSKVDGLWKISLPNTSSNNPNQDISIRLIVPEEYGRPLTLYPTAYSVLRDGQNLIYTFSSESDRISSGIYAIFGKLNLVGFNLYYSPVKKGQKLEIPNDKPGQLVFIDQIEPFPDNISVNLDGKWEIEYLKNVEKSVVTGHLLVDASSSAIFPETGYLSINNLTSLPEVIPSIPQIKWNKPFQILPFFIFPSSLNITNTGSQAIYHLKVVLESDNLDIISENDYLIPIIPPLAEVLVPIKLVTPYFPKSNTYHLSISAGDTQVTYNLDGKYFIIWYALLCTVIILIFTCLGGFTYFSWRLYLQRSKRAGSVYRKSN